MKYLRFDDNSVKYDISPFLEAWLFCVKRDVRRRDVVHDLADLLVDHVRRKVRDTGAIKSVISTLLLYKNVGAHAVKAASDCEDVLKRMNRAACAFSDPPLENSRD